MYISGHTGKAPVQLFGPGRIFITRSESGLYMSYSNSLIKSSQACGKGSRRIPLYEDNIRQEFPELFEAVYG